MRIVSVIVAVVFSGAIAGAQAPLTSPYRPQAQTGLRGLNDQEIRELQAGTGMGLARAAELNSYPGPRHVLDAVAAGTLAASSEQIERVREIFDSMKREAVRVGARVLAEETRLEAGFRAVTITEADLRSRVARIAVLQGELRSIHLAAHLATRAILSDVQIARYNELRGYTESPREHEHPRPH